MEEYRFDGFRFDGVTSMLYHHHGIGEFVSTSGEKTVIVSIIVIDIELLSSHSGPAVKHITKIMVKTNTYTELYNDTKYCYLCS